jgi:hypothetical protein
VFAKTFSQPGELRVLFDYVANATIEQQGNKIKLVAEEYIQKKRQDYHGSDYLDQIEKNAIYLSEGTLAVSAAILKFLADGRPTLRAEEVNHFVLETRLTHAQEATPFHLKYLRDDCDECPVHSGHLRYQNWRKLRSSGDQSKYIDELEYSCKYYQATYVLAQQFLSSFLLNPGLAGSARQISRDDIAAVIGERIYLWVDLSLAGKGYSRPLVEQNGIDQKTKSQLGGSTFQDHSKLKAIRDTQVQMESGKSKLQPEETRANSAATQPGNAKKQAQSRQSIINETDSPNKQINNQPAGKSTESKNVRLKAPQEAQVTAHSSSVESVKKIDNRVLIGIMIGLVILGSILLISSLSSL